jgi:HAD superfamily hydrolase (TIGR01509 family)
MIKALIFDFDGLILETEEPVYTAWEEIFQEYGCHLPLEVWTKIIGTSDFNFHPLTELERQYGAKLDRDDVLERKWQREMELIMARDAIPGVRTYLEDARKMGLKIGLASSSGCEWVTSHLKRLELFDYFDCIKGSDDVQQTKPAPDLFLAVLADLNVAPQEAIVLEDSPNGILAAKRAGIYCVAVPNTMTEGLDFKNADFRLYSLEDLSLKELLVKVEQN